MEPMQKYQQSGSWISSLDIMETDVVDRYLLRSHARDVRSERLLFHCHLPVA